MKKDILNHHFTVRFIVDSTMTAILDNNQIHPVCSTVTMVYYAELAARKAIEPFFEGDDQAIGGGISITHNGMAIVGETVSMTATIQSFDGKVLICDIMARIEKTDEIVCRGTQTQIVLAQTKIDALIEKAKVRSGS